MCKIMMPAKKLNRKCYNLSQNQIKPVQSTNISHVPDSPYTSVYLCNLCLYLLKFIASRGLEEKKFWKIQVVALFDKRFVPVALINILGE